MKQKALIISAVFLSLLSGAVAAQDQVIAYFESEYILQRIPEYQGIEQQLDLMAQSWRAELDELDTEIEELEADFRAKEILYTEEIREQKRAEINTKKKERDRYLSRMFGPDGEYFKKQKELLEPIQRQVFAAVRTVAQRKGIDFVFDRSGDIYMVYARSEWNLNDDILLELGIEID